MTTALVIAGIILLAIPFVLFIKFFLPGRLRRSVPPPLVQPKTTRLPSPTDGSPSSLPDTEPGVPTHKNVPRHSPPQERSLDPPRSARTLRQPARPHGAPVLRQETALVWTRTHYPFCRRFST